MFIVSYFKSLPLVMRQRLIIGGILLLLGISIYVGYSFWSSANNEAKIEKAEGKKVVLQPKIEAKTKELQNDVIDYGKSVKKKSEMIQDIIKKQQPFKPMKDEPIKVKSASYDAMRTALDSAMPNP